MNKEIIITKGYKHDKDFQNKFQEFISDIFPGANFKEWDQKGFWTDDYICYSIIESDKIISNVSASLMNVLCNGKSYKAVQLGAVGTLPEFRQQNLSRTLMNYVIDFFKEKTELFFLYANETVMDFYPKFGFKNLSEKIFVINSFPEAAKYSAKKLDLSNEEDYNHLLNSINHRKSLTKIFGAENYGFITMWHILNHHADNLYYLPNEDAIFIKAEKDNIMQIWEVIFKEPFDFQSVISKIAESDSIKSIHCYFPPDQLKFKYDEIINENGGLFLLGEIKIENKIFRFPETART